MMAHRCANFLLLNKITLPLHCVVTPIYLYWTTSVMSSGGGGNCPHLHDSHMPHQDGNFYLNNSIQLSITLPPPLCGYASVSVLNNTSGMARLQFAPFQLRPPQKKPILGGQLSPLPPWLCHWWSLHGFSKDFWHFRFWIVWHFIYVQYRRLILLMA